MSDEPKPSDTPTQPAMLAVQPPPSSNTRLRVVEDRLGLAEVRLTKVESRVDIVEVKVDEGARKHDALVVKVDALASDMTEVKAETKTQTSTLAAHTTALGELKQSADATTASNERIEAVLKPFKNILANPVVQGRLLALVLAAITAATAWLATRGH